MWPSRGGGGDTRGHACDPPPTVRRHLGKSHVLCIIKEVTYNLLGLIYMYHMYVLYVLSFDVLSNDMARRYEKRPIALILN